MKTEFERISEIMYTLLEHKPVIDVPYEKINDVAVALVKEGYGKVSEYKAEIERLNADFITLECNYDKIYDEHKEHKIENENLKILNNKFRECIDYLKAEVKQAKIDMLNEMKKRIYDISPYNPLVTKDNVKYFIEKLIEEVENGKDIS